MSEIANERTPYLPLQRAGAKEHSSWTLGARTYERLRDDIVSGALAPGQKLTLDTLTERYDIGMTPLREALYRLSASMLVIVEDRRGFRVAPVSPEHLAEVISTREEIETLVLRSAFKEGDLVWEENVVAAFHRLQRTGMYKPNLAPYSQEWEAAHRNFHFALLAPAKAPMLRQFQYTLWDHSARYRNLAQPAGQDADALFNGHQQLLEAVLQRDVEMACMLLRRHIALSIKPLQAAIFPNSSLSGS